MPAIHRISAALLGILALAAVTAINPSSARADMAIGAEAFAKKDYKRALREFEAAWKDGDPRAAYNIGLMHDGGYGIGSGNMEAAKWYGLAADQNVAEAQDILGTRYMRGIGVHRDMHKGLKMFIKAASQDFAPAQFNLGLIYYNGLGPLKKDIAEAIKLFSKSANAGHAPAQRALGELLLGHDGVEANPVAAWQWLTMAVDGGERSARRSLKKITAEMTVDERQKAQEGYRQIRAARNKLQDQPEGKEKE